MRGQQRITWVTSAVLLAAMTSAPAFAAKMTPATDKNSAVPAVPRAIPDLIPYHKFDPPKSKMFDMSRLTVSGDLRVRPEFRNNIRFGLNANRTLTNLSNDNTFFVQQWARLGLRYEISPDVMFFLQPQYSKNWGSDNSGGGTSDANGTAGTIYARQAYMLVRNFLKPGVTVKVGRQMVVWGNHRMFGHFDWNNVGWSFDGVTANYKLNPKTTLQAGWLRVDETNCGGVQAGGCAGGNDPDAAGQANSDGDVIYIRAATKMMGLTVEPVYIWHNGGTNRSGNLGANRPSNQSRHTLGGRIVKKTNWRGTRIDSTFEGYYQLGSIGRSETSTRDLDISAFALHFDGGLTLPVPMQPRLGGEFNVASGDGDHAGDDATWTGFDQLYPTNHIHFGYMDRMSWKNMLHWSIGLQLRPTKNSHFEVSGHKFYLNDEQDHWYAASQAAFIQSHAGNTEDDLGSEIDVVYTMFFTPDNHLAWQIGGGVFFPGDFVEQNGNPNASEETWGYTQLWVNF